MNKTYLKLKTGERLDKALAQEYPEFSRAYLTRLIDGGVVLVNNKPAKSGYKIKESDDVIINVDLSRQQKIEDIELPILYEDDNVLVINKPIGIISHSRGRYWYEPSVASFIRQKTDSDDSEPSNDRAGIVHRLDRATSGVMICAKNEKTLSFLQKQFQARTVKKAYMALIVGSLNDQKGEIDIPIERNPKRPATFRAGINGKTAQTAFEIISTSYVRNEQFSLIELRPKTGRTHQLRVHLAYLKHPIVGDELYGGAPASRLMLHAMSLEITLPNGDRRKFVAPLSNEFDEYK